jgi:predicted  nucleic acid-binding Zn-ribbon protein
MSTLDELPAQLEVVLDRARGILNAEVEKARKSLAALNAEKTAAAKAVADLKEQRDQTQKQLNSALAHLDKTTTLAALNREVGAAKQTLATLEADIEMATSAKATAEKERVAAERQLAGLRTEAQDYRLEREAAVAEVTKIKMLIENACARS